MEWLERGHAAVTRWRQAVFTRWRVAAGLAGLSILPELPGRVVGWLAAGPSDFIAVTLLGAVVTPSLLGHPDIGLTISWLLVGYLAYSYSPFLYPSSVATVKAWGFRALTAVFILWFGLFAWGQPEQETIPGFVVLQLGEKSVILGTVAGLIMGTFCFGVYLTHQGDLAVRQDGPMQTEYAGMIASFFGEKNFLDEIAKRFRARGGWRRIAIWEYRMLFSAVPVVICSVGGLVAGVLHLFYPLPEIVFFLGLVGLHASEYGGFKANLPKRSVFEVDTRLLDSISGASRSFKGTVMFVFCGLGMFVSALLFGLGFVFWASVSGEITSKISNLTDIFRLSPVEAVAILGLVLFVLWFIGYGVFALIYWVRQLERLEPYAAYWEACWFKEPTVLPPAPVARPPGLLLQAHIPLGILLFVAVILGYGWIGPITVAILIGIVPGLSLLLMGWALRQQFQMEIPQSLYHESRDVLLAVVIQLGIVGLWAFYTPEQGLNLDVLPTYMVLFLALIGIYYFPEIIVLNHQQTEPIEKLLFSLIQIVLFIPVVILLSYMVLENTSLIIYGLFIFLGLIWVLVSIKEFYFERTV